MEKLRKDVPIITYILLAINVIVFFYFDFTQSVSEMDMYVEQGGMYLPAVIEDGEWYRVITHAFLHGGLEHLLGNMVMLVFIGSVVEKVYGKISFVIIYFVGILGSTLVSVMPELMTYDYHYSIGASGATMTLFGAYLILIIKNRSDGDNTIIARMVVVFLLMIFGNMEQGVDWMAHLGGAVFGVILGLMLYPKQNHTIQY